MTRSELVLAASALRATGARPGDRIEHASVAPPEADAAPEADMAARLNALTRDAGTN